MELRDTLRKVDADMRETVLRQFAPKTYREGGAVPVATMKTKRTPEQVAEELRGIFEQANAVGVIDSPISNALRSADHTANPPDFGSQAAEQINASAEHAFKDISHAIEMLTAMREALARDAAALSQRIKEFTRISGAISRAFKDFTSQATKGDDNGKEGAPKA